MKLCDVHSLDEIFTHIDDATRVQTSWNATQLFAYAVEAKLPVYALVVDAEHAEYCMKQRGFEPERIGPLLGNAAWLAKPILFVRFENHDHLLVDGTHRYVIFHKVLQSPDILAYIVPEADARPFCIDDMPQTTEEALMSPSMLPELRRLFPRG